MSINIIQEEESTILTKGGGVKFGLKLFDSTLKKS